PPPPPPQTAPPRPPPRTSPPPIPSRQEQPSGTSRPPPPSRTDQPTAIPGCPTDAAAWFSAIYREISVQALGDSYNAVLSLLIELERGYGWKLGAPRGLTAANRPGQVSTWVGLGRGARGGWISNGVGPQIDSLAVYDAAWWKWWGGMQPTWRKKDAGKPGRFTREAYPTGAQANKAAWASLRHLGQNGVVTLAATLYWWGKAVKAGGAEDRESWAEAVTDVKWMLRGL
ncbi:hypothetical protein C8R47DRAFT_937340, partial [Mycena vitilis]